MKLLKHIILLFLPLLMTNCIYEDLSDCPVKANVTLRFHYLNEDGNDIIGSRVDKIDLFLYDMDGGLVLRKATQAYLHAGTQVQLDPGTYQLVAWGNAGNNTRFDLHGNDLLEESELLLTKDGTAETSDPVYYAPHRSITRKASAGTRADAGRMTLVVPETGGVEKDVYFECAHAAVNVIVRGYTDPDQNDLPPVIELTGTPKAYDFRRTASEATTIYKQTSAFGVANGARQARAGFYTAIFNNDYSATINIVRSSDGTNVWPFDLTAYLTAKGIDLTEKDEPVVTVILDFVGMSVSVIVDDWHYEGISPK